MKILKVQFGKRLREARKRIPDLTQEKLAELLGVTEPTVSRWETGKDFPDNDRLPLICEKLSVDPDYFGRPAQIVHQDPLPSWADRIEAGLDRVLQKYEERTMVDKELAQLDRQVHELTRANKQLRAENKNLSPEEQKLLSGWRTSENCPMGRAMAFYALVRTEAARTQFLDVLLNALPNSQALRALSEIGSLISGQKLK